MVTSRQETILRIIINDYISTATPVASDAIVRNHDLGVSPATVRNDVAELEEAGYLTRPHTSAGAVPQDKAYRFYVETLGDADPSQIPPRIRWAIRRQMSEVERDLDEWASAAASILSRLVGNMAVATFPKARESRVRHLELVHIQDLVAMLIVVLEQARLRRQLIRLKEPVEPSVLEASTNRVKSEVVGLTRKEIEAKSIPLTPLEEALLDSTVFILKEEDRNSYRDHYVYGLRNLLGQPEFAENEKIRGLVEGLEGGSLIQAILDETPDGSVVRVVIGQENREDMLRPLSVVICQYGIPGEATGAVGVVGPTRMQYTKAIAGVKLMSSLMSHMVESVHR
jgi:heat-inducible transcriptional repressor